MAEMTRQPLLEIARCNQSGSEAGREICDALCFFNKLLCRVLAPFIVIHGKRLGVTEAVVFPVVNWWWNFEPLKEW